MSKLRFATNFKRAYLRSSSGSTGVSKMVSVEQVMSIDHPNHRAVVLILIILPKVLVLGGY